MGNSYLINNKNYKIVRLIDSGKQGCVFMIESPEGEKLALKVIPPDKDIDYETRLMYLQYILSTGPAADIMVRPQHVHKRDTGEVEYAMELIEGYSDCYKAWDDPEHNYPLDDEVRFKIIKKLFLGLDELHKLDLLYCDPSHNNILFNPKNGNVKFIDIDSVSFINIKNSCSFGFGGLSPVLGTGEFRSPESYKGIYNHDKYSDIFGLTVYVFHLLVGLDPFYGKRSKEIIDKNGYTLEEAAPIIYDSDACFIFNANNANSICGMEEEANIPFWERLPESFKRLFYKTFVEGLRPENKCKRASCKEWIEAANEEIRKLHDETTVPIQFLSGKTLKFNALVPEHCTKNNMLTKRMYIGDTLSGPQFDGSTYDMNEIISLEADAKGKLAVRNKSNHTWTVHVNDKAKFIVAPGECTKVTPDMTIVIVPRLLQLMCFEAKGA